MIRLMFSSCGVLAEFAHVTHSEEFAVVALAALSLSLTFRVWYDDLMAFADRLIGNSPPIEAVPLVMSDET